MQNTHSKFWLGHFDQEIDVLQDEFTKPGKDYIKLASTLRAISNFVNIVTGENTPVKFHSKDDSYTDGKSVTISANIKDNNFDPTVGLALHEGSHIKLTDFDVIRGMGNIVNHLPEDEKHFIDEMCHHEDSGNHLDAYDVMRKLKDILNYVEDRRIDSFIYTNAPGYKPYYKAMYDKYFNSKIIDKGLQSGDKRSEVWSSYMFRLINITNANRDLDALYGLREIWNVLDLGNVDRLKSTQDSLAVAVKIYRIIDRYTWNAIQEKEQSQPADKSQEGEGTESKKSKGGDRLSIKDEGRLRQAIQKQKDFNSGRTKKSNMSKSDRNKVQAIKESGVTQEEVGKDANNNWNMNRMGSINCIVVKNVTKKLIESDIYNCMFRNMTKEYHISQAEADQETIINKGIRLGNMLGRKLQVRNNSTSLKFNRLRSGKIDRRALSGLGYGAEAVFQKVLVSSHTPSCLHISIDASGSMSGKRWTNSQIAAIAIAKAASMTSNMDVVISYRTIYYTNNTDLKPLVVIGYDSRKDKLSKITSLFKWFHPGGTTPAGLCFEAILDEITNMGDKNTDKYFINFSDGEPYFCTKNYDYYGVKADKHTQSQVNKMKASGVKVLSYYIDGDSISEGRRKEFDMKYGKDATAYVSVTDIVPLAKTLNKKFIEA